MRGDLGQNRDLTPGNLNCLLFNMYDRISPHQEHSESAEGYGEGIQRLGKALVSGEVNQGQSRSRTSELDAHSTNQQSQLIVSRIDLLQQEVQQSIQHQASKVQILTELENEVREEVAVIVGENKPRNAHDQYANEREQQTNEAPHLLLVQARASEKEAHQDERADDQQEICRQVNVKVLPRGQAVYAQRIGTREIGGKQAGKV